VVNTKKAKTRIRPVNNFNRPACLNNSNSGRNRKTEFNINNGFTVKKVTITIGKNISPNLYITGKGIDKTNPIKEAIKNNPMIPDSL